MKRGPTKEGFPDQSQTSQENEVIRIIFKLYKYMFDKIEAAKIRALKNNKPLLILIGENHRGEFSYIVEMVAITAATQLGFKRFCFEVDNLRYLYAAKKVNDYLQNIEQNTCSDLHQKSELFLAVNREIDFHTLFFKQVSLQLHPIDQGADGYGLRDYKKYTAVQGTPDKKPGMQYRNRVMADELNQCSEDTFAIVGANHLYGLAVEEPSLADNFEIVQFSAVRPYLPHMSLEAYNVLCNEHKEFTLQLQSIFSIDEAILRKLFSDASFYNPIRDQFTKLCQHWQKANTTNNWASESEGFIYIDDNRTRKKTKLF